MSAALSNLQSSVDALEAHAAAVNAERVALFLALQEAKANPPAPPVTDEADLVALKARVDAVSASIVAPVSSLVSTPAEPAPAV